MIYLPFARERRLWLPSPYLRGGANAPTFTLGNTTSAVGPVTSIAMNLNTAVPVGQALFAVCAWVPTAVGNTCTFTDADTSANTWVTEVAKVHTSLSVAIAIGRAEAVTAYTGSLRTHTATINASVTALAFVIYRMTVSGILLPYTTDGSNSNQGTATSSATPGSVTPTNQPDFLVAAYASPTSTTGTPPAGYTEVSDTGGTTTIQLNIATNQTSDLGARNPAETLSASVNWVAAQVLYKCTRSQLGLRGGASLAAATHGATR